MTRKTEDRIGIMCGCAVISTIIAAILNIFVCPIVYTIFHDCGKWICWHSYPITWTNYFIILVLVYLFFMLWWALSGFDTEGSGGYQNGNQRRTNNWYSGGREADYYDSDMEGAPGYYGGD